MLLVFIVGTIVYPLVVEPAAVLLAAFIVGMTSIFGLFGTWIYFYFKSWWGDSDLYEQVMPVKICRNTFCQSRARVLILAQGSVHVFG